MLKVMETKAHRSVAAMGKCVLVLQKQLRPLSVIP